MAALKEDAAAQQRQVAVLAEKEPADLWRSDLAAFLVALADEEASEATRGAELLKQQKQSRGGGGGAKVRVESQHGEGRERERVDVRPGHV